MTNAAAEGPAPWVIRTSLRRGLLLYWLGAIALVAAALVLWFFSKGSFLHDLLAPTLLGSGVTAVAAFGSLLALAAREIQERRALDRVGQEPHVARPALRLGNLAVDDIRVIAAGGDLEARFRFEVVTPPGGQLPTRPDPPEWPLLEQSLLPRLQARAEARRQVFFDAEKLDLLDAVKRRDLVDGAPVWVYELTVAATTYFRFATMSNALDEDLGDVLGEPSTLRERWAHEPLAPEHVAGLPAPAALGCGVVVVTSDGHVVLLERSSTYVGGPVPGDRRTPVHVVAEGMIPADARAESPLRSAALRALDEELGIDVAEAGFEPLESLRMVGFFFDTRRWQPCFVWLAQISVTLDELATLQSVARDGWETASLFGTPFDIRAERTRALLLGTDENLFCATNHASACLALALIAKEGLVPCRAALSWGAGRGRRTPTGTEPSGLSRPEPSPPPP